METVIAAVKRRYVLTILVMVFTVIATIWVALQVYAMRELSSPAQISEVLQASDHNAAFAAYLDEQKDFEAHFLTLASEVKQQQSDHIVAALAVTSVIVIVIGTIGAFITARILMKPVVEAYKSQERFVQDAAHELRNPLATMTVTLQQTKANSHNRQLIKTFSRQTKRLISINEDLLFLERRTERTLQAIQLSELLSDVIEELQPLAASSKITIDFKTLKDVQKMMDAGDYVRMAKNIIDNAIKYSKPGDVVVVRQKKQRGSIILTVADQGIGILPTDLPKVGQRFFRASNTGKIDGTGLGLAIVQKVLNFYKGSMSISSKAGKGTTVTLKF